MSDPLERGPYHLVAYWDGVEAKRWPATLEKDGNTILVRPDWVDLPAGSGRLDISIVDGDGRRMVNYPVGTPQPQPGDRCVVPDLTLD